MQNCLRLTDRVPLALKKAICRYTLTDLNLGGLDDVTDHGLAALASCTSLHHLDLAFCEVSDHCMEVTAAKLPFARKATGRKHFVPVAVPVKLFNEVALERMRMARSAITFQKNVRRHEAKKAYIIMRDRARRAALMAQKQWRGSRVRIKWRRQKQEVVRADRAAKMIQNAWTNYNNVKLAKAASHMLWIRRENASMIQRAWRCFMGKRVVYYMKKRQIRLLGRWSHVVQGMMVEYYKMQTMRAILACQRIYRFYHESIERELREDSAPYIQCAWRCYVARVEKTARFNKKFAKQITAANVIQRTWWSHVDWVIIIKDVRVSEMEWQKGRVQRGKAVIVIEDAYYHYMLKKEAKLVLARKRAELAATRMIQRAWRIFLAKGVLGRLKTHKIAVIMRWKKFTDGVRNKVLVIAARRIQERFRRRRKRLVRERSARTIQRAFRGWIGRLSFFDRMLQYRDEMATRIQNCFRAFVARSFLDRVQEQRWQAASKIARAQRAHVQYKQMKAIMAHSYKLKQEQLEMEKQIMLRIKVSESVSQ